MGALALTAVLALAAGPYALVVLPLALLARLRPRVLAPLAGAAMLAAGITAALGAGHPVAERQGAFSPLAQALALLALAAAVITLPTATPETAGTDDETGTAPTVPGAGSVAVAGSAAVAGAESGATPPDTPAPSPTGTPPRPADAGPPSTGWEDTPR
ncbi:hypothetical protein [Streptomyces noursei]|uniref:Uncharacterized protein n=1 Tax=Streptomyces noursei TaxID=1971 RepID=A0A401R0B5_STRNR|nr:hypothetical protein N1H47_13370 [Streptomyces noursei]GCB91060.1 hypothetical protein SALB_03772 [Streptomyces noursei]